MARDADQTDRPNPPVAKIVPRPIAAHGHVRQDDYYWLRDDDRKAPEVLRYLEAENAYAERQLAHVEGFRERLFEEIVGRIKKDDSTVPHRENGYWYYTRFEQGKEYAIHCRKRGNLEAAEEILVDGNVEAEGHAYYAVALTRVSTNNLTLAYSEDTLGRRIYTVRFRDLESGTALADVIEGTAGQFAWALDNKTLFYVKREEGSLRAYQVWRHRLGTPQVEDALVFEEEDPEFHVSVWRTKTNRYILIASYQTLSHEVRFAPADEPNAPFQVFLPRERNHEYDVEHLGDRFYIRTNWKARDFRLMSAEPARSADKKSWREEIPARDGIFIRDFDVFRDHLVVGERRDGVTRMRVIPWADREAAHEIRFDEEVFVVEFGTNMELDTQTLRFEYSSLTTPESVFDYDMETRERTLRKQQAVLGGFKVENYVSERVVATARDGMPVPISLVRHRTLDRSRPQPLLLYGYGSYGHSMDPAFGSPRLSLVDRGVVYAIAHVRGGQEFGRAWYEDGRLLRKKNTFTDFIDCARHLVDTGVTAPEALFAHGGSAGGLLVGAVANMAPELFEGVVADVPFVDVVTTMLDESIPLTTFEYDEWGNPNQKRYYDYMLSYSPYDNIERREYPNMLVLAGLHDSQVQYWEPAKWVAKLRTHWQGDRRLLLHTNMDAGHSGASGRFRRHQETSMIYAFLLDLIGRRE